MRVKTPTDYFWEPKANVQIDNNQLNIILLAHVQEPRGHINQAQLQCGEIERFSVDEFNEIYQGIVEAGFFIQSVYYNELDFINDYSSHPERFCNCLVYNLARNGLGDNKKTIIPAFCELVGVHYTCSSSLTSALCRNKYYFTSLFHAHGIPAPKSWLLDNSGQWLNGAPPDGTRVICKPCSESASQGVNESGIIIAAANKFEHLTGKQYVIQEYISGGECEVPVFKIGETVKVLSPVGIDLRDKSIIDEQSSENYAYDFYPLEQTYGQKTVELILSYAEKAFRLMQMDVYGRIDFRIDSNGFPYIIDVSTTPYTIKHSSFAFSFKMHGLSYCDIYKAIISSALQRG